VFFFSNLLKKNLISAFLQIIIIYFFVSKKDVKVLGYLFSFLCFVWKKPFWEKKLEQHNSIIVTLNLDKK